MAIYEYKCAKDHVFDVIQKMSDDPLTECQECGAPAERVLHPVAVHFKGSGFYNTDYGKKKGSGNGTSSEGAKESADSKGSDSKGSDSKGPEKKSSDAKASTSAAAGD
ncbi:MAG TPA: FmdB family zinc ribbon protein [Solirubrobacterales bacterium]|jgi:putative FmdB family regulatory protein